MRDGRIRSSKWRLGWAALAALSVLFGALPAGAAAQAATNPQLDKVVRSGLALNTNSACGQVYLLGLANPADPTVQARLPFTVSVSEPSRGLADTFVVAVNSGNIGQLIQSSPLFATAPSGRGPGLTVTIAWGGGTESFATESYVDRCAGLFVPVQPKRLLDTRSGIGTATGQPTRVAANAVVEVDPIGAGNVPSQNVTALALNVTATGPATAGYLSVYPCGQEPPNSSNVNFAAGDTVPNLVVVDLVGFPGTGRVCIFSSTATDVLADVTGYYLVNAGQPLGHTNALPAPQRLLDTRGTAKLAGGGVQRVPMAGQGGIPATGATAVSMNITAVDAVSAGYLTVFPCDTPQPDASNVNYVAGRAVPNAAIVGLGVQGDVCVFSSATTNVLIDVVGYVAPTGSVYAPSAPTRLWDNRLDVFAGQSTPRKLGANSTFRYAGLTPGSVLTLNVTIVEPDTAGFATVYPCDQGVPASSSLNFQAGTAIANTVFVRVDAAGEFCLFSTARTNFIYDLNGTTLTIV